MKYKIDSNTPLPPPRKVQSRSPSKKPSIVETLRAMPADTNSSCLIPLKGKKPEAVRGAISAAIWYIRKTQPKRKYTTRNLPGEKGIRVWRIK